MMNWLTLALLSLLLMGLGNFCFKMAASVGQGALAATVISCVAQLALGLLAWCWLKPSVQWQSASLAWPALAGLLIGGGLLCLVLAMARPGAPAGVAVAMMNTNFLIVAALSWFCFGEALSPRQLAGLLTVLGGLALLV